jgi:hypothetical protein
MPTAATSYMPTTEINHGCVAEIPPAPSMMLDLAPLLSNVMEPISNEDSASEFSVTGVDHGLKSLLDHDFSLALSDYQR